MRIELTFVKKCGILCKTYVKIQKGKTFIDMKIKEKTMKKTLILTLTAVLLLSATMLCSCGGSTAIGNVKFSGVTDGSAYTDSTPTLKTPETMNVVGTLEEIKGDLVLFLDEENSTKTVFNIATGKSVWNGSTSYTSVAGSQESVSYSVSLRNTNDIYWFSVTKTTAKYQIGDFGDMDVAEETTETTLYTADGAIVAVSETDDYVSAVADLLIFDNKAYKISEEGITEAFVVNGLMGIPSIAGKAGNGYYYKTYAYGDSDDVYGDDVVTLYDDKLNIVASYAIPAYAEAFKCFVTQNGNLIIQYYVLCDDHDIKYDFLTDEGEKCDLVSVLLNTKNTSGKEISLDYVINTLVNSGDEATFDALGVDAEVGNLAAVSPIENNRLGTAKIVTVSNEGKIGGCFDGFVPGNTSSFMLVAKNRWIVSNQQGLEYLVDEKGKVLGQIGNYSEYNEVGILSKDNKFYNWDLTMVADFNEKDAVSCKLLESGVLVTAKSGDTLYYANGTTTTVARAIDNQSVEVFSERLYVVRGVSDFTIYNDLGQQVYASAGTAAVNYVTGSENGAIVRVATYDVLTGITTTKYMLIK